MGLSLANMDESFELPIRYNGEELLLPAKLIQFGYTYRIEVAINRSIVSFERDEERHWRGLINPETGNPAIDPVVVNSIIEALDNI
jgi:hypothetical protein